MAKNKVTGETTGDCGGPSNVVRCENLLASSCLISMGNHTEQIIGRPCPGIRTRDETAFVDLEEVQLGFVDRGAVATRTTSQVGKYGSVMAVWPGVPLQIDRLPSSHRDIGIAWCCLLMTGDIL